MLLVTCWLAAPPAQAALVLKPPAWTREQMRAFRLTPEAPCFVYGTQEAADAPLLREQARGMARRLFGLDSAEVIADRDAPESLLGSRAVVLLGNARDNAWTRRLAEALPVTFTATGFRWRDTAYERPGDALALVWPNPLDPRRLLMLSAANSAGAAGRGAGFVGADDWRITREGETVRSGSFAQLAGAPWHYDAALDRDREAERAGFAASLVSSAAGGLIAHVPPGLAAAPATLAAARGLLARLDARGLSGASVVLTLYRSIEQKGGITRVTSPEHVAAAGSAHVTIVSGRESADLWSVASARLATLASGTSSRFLAPAGAWLAGQLDGEPLERGIARLYFGRVLPVAAEAASRSSDWRSPLVWIPARALLVRAVWESAPPAGRRAALLALLRRDPPGTLDSLCRTAAVPVARVAARYRQLADSLARIGERSLVQQRPAGWRPADGFQRGVCVEHAERLEGGYASARCAAELRTLQQAGAGWVALSPAGYVPASGVPDVWPGAAGGPDEETDEALCEAAARAHALGLGVRLTPRLWARVPTEALAFDAAGWTRFLERYRAFILHYALLAERERIEAFSLGRALASSTARDPLRWRALVGDVRAVYSGSLGYDAVADEAARLPFWDVLDQAGVIFDAPLAASPTKDPATLRAGAAKALAGLAALARRTGRPVLLSEAGYAPTPLAAVRPRDEGPGPVDPEAQAACYRAFVDALEPCDWAAGAYWWTWTSDGRPDASGDLSCSPRGKPAEAVLRAALRQWQGRPVRVPVTGR